MKKTLISMIMVMTAALALTACGNKKAADNVTTAAAETQAAAGQETETKSEAAAQETAEAPNEDDEYEIEYCQGIVTSVNGINMTLQNDDGEELMFDLSNADLDACEDLMIGSYAEISYPVIEGGKQPYYAYDLIVLMTNEDIAAENGVDPCMEGTLVSIDVNDVFIRDFNGKEYDFDNQVSRIVSFADLKAGDDVIVTYSGSVFDYGEDAKDEDDGNQRIFAIKVVAKDAVNSEEAQANYFTCQVDEVEEELLICTCEMGDFEFSCTEDMLKGLEPGMSVDVYYNGQLADRSLEATKIVVK